jgi:hypothetical protein
LGDILPIGQLFTLGRVVKNTEVQKYICSPNFWATFFHGKIYVLILHKRVLRYILIEVITKSGHPAVVVFLKVFFFNVRVFVNIRLKSEFQF